MKIVEPIFARKIRQKRHKTNFFNDNSMESVLKISKIILLNTLNFKNLQNI